MLHPAGLFFRFGHLRDELDNAFGAQTGDAQRAQGDEFAGRTALQKL